MEVYASATYYFSSTDSYEGVVVKLVKSGGSFYWVFWDYLPDKRCLFNIKRILNSFEIELREEDLNGQNLPG